MLNLKLDLPKQKDDKIYDSNEETKLLMDVFGDTVKQDELNELDESIASLINYFELYERDPYTAAMLYSSDEGILIPKIVKRLFDRGVKGSIKLVPGILENTESAMVKTIDGLKLARISVKDGMYSEKHIQGEFIKIEKAFDKKASYQRLMVEALPYEDVESRLKGIVAICSKISEIAAVNESRTIGDGSVWEDLAKLSNNTVTVVPPKLHYYFKDFKWNKPIFKLYDVKQSKWHDKTSRNEIMHAILHCKYDSIDELIQAANIIRSSCKKMMSTIGDDERSYGNFNDNDRVVEKTAKQFSVAYVTSKLIKQIQVVVAKEVIFQVGVNLKKIRSFKES